MASHPYTQADEDALRLRRKLYETRRQPPRILGVKRRTRARWWLAHRADGIGIWLSGHGHDRAAVCFWRVFGLW